MGSYEEVVYFEDDADEEKRCPKCGEVLSVVLLLGVSPEFYNCHQCKMALDLDTLEPLAKML